MGSAGSSHEAASCGMLRKACLMEAGKMNDSVQHDRK